MIRAGKNIQNNLRSQAQKSFRNLCVRSDHESTDLKKKHNLFLSKRQRTSNSNENDLNESQLSFFQL